MFSRSRAGVNKRTVSGCRLQFSPNNVDDALATLVYPKGNIVHVWRAADQCNDGVPQLNEVLQLSLELFRGASLKRSSVLFAHIVRLTSSPTVALAVREEGEPADAVPTKLLLLPLSPCSGTATPEGDATQAHAQPCRELAFPLTSSTGGICGLSSSGRYLIVVCQKQVVGLLLGSSVTGRSTSVDASLAFAVDCAPYPYGDGCATVSLHEGVLAFVPSTRLVEALQLHQAKRPAALSLGSRDATAIVPAQATGATAGNASVDSMRAQHGIGLGAWALLHAPLTKAALMSSTLKGSALGYLARTLAPYSSSSPSASSSSTTSFPPPAEGDVSSASPVTSSSTEEGGQRSGASGSSSSSCGYVLVCELDALAAAYAQHRRHSRGSRGSGRTAPFLPPGLCWRACAESSGTAVVPIACVKLDVTARGGSVAAAADADGSQACTECTVAVADLNGQAINVFSAVLPNGDPLCPASVFPFPASQPGTTNSGAAYRRLLAVCERGITLARITSMSFSRSTSSPTDDDGHVDSGGSTARRLLAVMSERGTAHLFILPPPSPPEAAPQSLRSQARVPFRHPAGFEVNLPQPAVHTMLFTPARRAVTAGGGGGDEEQGDQAPLPSQHQHRGLLGAVADAVVGLDAHSRAALTSQRYVPPSYEVAIVGSLLLCLSKHGLLNIYRLEQQQSALPVPLLASSGAPSSPTLASPLVGSIPAVVSSATASGKQANQQQPQQLERLQSSAHGGSTAEKDDSKIGTDRSDLYAYAPRRSALARDPRIVAPAAGSGSAGTAVFVPATEYDVTPEGAIVTSGSGGDVPADAIDRISSWLSAGAYWLKTGVVTATAAAGSLATAAVSKTSVLLSTVPAPPAAATVLSQPMAVTLLNSVDLRRFDDWPDVMDAASLTLPGDPAGGPAHPAFSNYYRPHVHRQPSTPIIPPSAPVMTHEEIQHTVMALSQHLPPEQRPPLPLPPPPARSALAYSGYSGAYSPSHHDHDQAVAGVSQIGPQATIAVGDDAPARRYSDETYSTDEEDDDDSELEGGNHDGDCSAELRVEAQRRRMYVTARGTSPP